MQRSHSLECPGRRGLAFFLVLAFTLQGCARGEDVPDGTVAVTDASRDQGTADVSRRRFCPVQALIRRDAAVWLLRVKFGAGYIPPDPTGDVFSDIARTEPQAAWIEQLARDGIVAGFGTTPQMAYRPSESLTRREAAVALLRAKNGNGFSPPTPRGRYSDVSTSDPLAGWMEEAYTQGILGYCEAVAFCPLDPLLRNIAAMAFTRADHGSTFMPEAPARGTVFSDVSMMVDNADWIEQVDRDGISSDCGSSP